MPVVVVLFGSISKLFENYFEVLLNAKLVVSLPITV